MHTLETIIADVWFWLKAMGTTKMHNIYTIPEHLPVQHSRDEREMERERMSDFISKIYQHTNPNTHTLNT